MRWSIKNDLAEIARLAGEIESFGEVQGIPEPVIFSINLSLDELITNIINYGYADNDEHNIIINLQAGDAEAVVELRDDGLPFNPLELPDPDTGQSLDERPIGGLGIYLVRRMMDQVEYRRQDNQNIMTMKKLYFDK
ncbi:ATP-binding protein [Syntrophomonas palmitatica]|uniref:ATP-binding protein n=1 Tax=Syntrophomonas palmitatica TaxID=402877 RepID=UPI0006CF4237|nr:ATP-binding protein [Syntrophomonas palmitatica]